MKITPIISEPIYLRDISDTFKELEGDCERDDQVFVIIRQGTQADIQRVSLLVSERKVEHAKDGTRSETFNDDLGDVRAMQLYSTLCDVGNMTDKTGAPMFRFKQGKEYAKFAGSFSEFKRIYGTLPGVVIGAFNLAVWEGNPQWDMRRLVTEGEE